MTLNIAGDDEMALVDDTLNHFFDASRQRALVVGSSYERLWRSLHELIASGGKRLRPQMTILAYTSFGGKDAGLISAVAAAQELLHFSLLIHDDIIDRDYTRYGVPNIAGRYFTFYQEHIPSANERIHFSHSAALLGGDLMLSGAYLLIAQSNLSAKDKTTAHHLLANAIFEVAGGELLDTESSFVPYKNGDAYTTARFKTASYSFISPLVTGASLAGASAAQLKTLEEFAISLGVAYQLVDDIIGVFGNEELTGKTTVSDIREGKRTLMVEYATKAMSFAEKEWFDGVFGKPNITDDDIARIKRLLLSTHAKDAVEAEIENLSSQAEDALQSLELSDEDEKKFRLLVEKVTKRSF